MDNVKILEVKQSIFASNDEQAAQLRQSLKEKKIFLLKSASCALSSVRRLAMSAIPRSKCLTAVRVRSSMLRYSLGTILRSCHPV